MHFLTNNTHNTLSLNFIIINGMNKIPLFILFSLLFWGCKPSLKSEISISDLMNNSGNGKFTLSNQGTYLAYIESQSSFQSLYVKPTRGWGQKGLLINDTTVEKAIKHTLWLSDTVILYGFKDLKGKFHFKQKNVKTLQSKLVNVDLNRKFEIISLSKDAKHLFIAINPKDSLLSDVYDLNIETGNLNLKIKNFGSVSRWYPDHHGEIRAAQVTKDETKEFWFRKTPNEPFKKAFDFPVEAYLIPYFDTQNPNLAILQQNIWNDKANIISYDFGKMKILDTIFQHDTFDVTRLFYSKRKNKIDAIYYDDFYQQYHFFSDSYIKVNEEFKRFFKDKFRFYLGEKSDNEKFMIFGAENDDYFGGYFLYDVEKQHLQKISEYNVNFPLENKNVFQKRDTISFTNANGFTIQGYMTLTNNAVEAPLVVLLHENIIQRDSWGFSLESQVFATRGYNVFQINYSGSSGYGRKFRDLGNMQIAGNIHRDIVQGIEAVMSRYHFNNKKVILYGKGMAGCIALQTASVHPSMVKAVIANTAYLNLFSYVKGISVTNKGMLPFTYIRIGNPEKDAKYLKAVSPIFNVSKMKVPVMIGYNLSDPLSSANEYMSYVRLMQNAGKEIYYFSTLSNQNVYDVDTYDVQFFEKVQQFLNIINK